MYFYNPSKGVFLGEMYNFAVCGYPVCTAMTLFYQCDGWLVFILINGYMYYSLNKITNEINRSKCSI